MQSLLGILAASWIFVPVHSSASEFSRPKIIRIDIVEGISPIENRNFENGRINATRDGMKNAVKRAISNLVEHVPKDSAEMVDFLVESNYERYIHGYSILAEIVDDGFFMNLMSVELFQNSLKEDLIDLELSPSSDKKPVILILIDERISPVYSEDNFLTLFSISENTVSKNIKTKGWEILGREKVSELDNRQSILDAVNGNPEAALSVGEKLQADFMLFGFAEKVSGEELPEGQSIALEYQVVSTAKHEVIGNGRISGKSDSKDSFLAAAQALRSAGAKLAAELQKLLKEEVEKEPDGETE